MSDQALNSNNSEKPLLGQLANKFAWTKAAPVIPPRNYDGVTMSCKIDGKDHRVVLVNLTSQLTIDLGWVDVQKVDVFVANDPERGIKLLRVQPANWMGNADRSDVFTLQNKIKDSKTMRLIDLDWIPRTRMSNLTTAYQRDYVAEGVLVIEIPKQMFTGPIEPPAEPKEKKVQAKSEAQSGVCTTLGGAGGSLGTKTDGQANNKGQEQVSNASEENRLKANKPAEIIRTGHGQKTQVPVESIEVTARDVLKTCSLMSADPQFNTETRILGVASGYTALVPNRMVQVVQALLTKQDSGDLFTKSEFLDQLIRSGIDKDDALFPERWLEQMNGAIFAKVRLVLELRDGFVCLTSQRRK